MTNTEDEILERLENQTRLTVLWQFLAAGTTWLLTGINPWFWLPCAAALLAVVTSIVEILWLLPRLRRRIWERGSWRCRRCQADVEDGRCACTESPSPWEPKS